jgi:hypothetical protein
MSLAKTLKKKEFASMVTGAYSPMVTMNLQKEAQMKKKRSQSPCQLLLRLWPKSP